MKGNPWVVVEGAILLRNHLDLKRVLLEHKDLRDEYGQVKLGLINSRVISTWMDIVEEKVR